MRRRRSLFHCNKTRMRSIDDRPVADVDVVALALSLLNATDHNYNYVRMYEILDGQPPKSSSFTPVRDETEAVAVAMVVKLNK